MQAIRRGLDFAAKALQVKRPLLELDFAVNGRDLLLKFAEDEPYFVNASRRGLQGQALVWPSAAEDLFDSLEYDQAERAAYQWWPLGKTRPVVLDTRLNAGRPSTAETAVRTIAIKARDDEGWEQDAIAADLGATPAEIEAALELEGLAA